MTPTPHRCMVLTCECEAFDLAQLPDLGPSSQACTCGHSPTIHLALEPHSPDQCPLEWSGWCKACLKQPGRAS